MMKSYDHFPADELRCRCGECDGGVMCDEFMLVMSKVRHRCGFPLIVSSGFRCAPYNSAIGGVIDSTHITGNALDIRISGSRALTLLKVALEENITCIGISQKGDINSRFIHLDWRPKRRLWSY